MWAPPPVPWVLPFLLCAADFPGSISAGGYDDSDVDFAPSFLPLSCRRHPLLTLSHDYDPLAPPFPRTGHSSSSSSASSSSFSSDRRLELSLAVTISEVSSVDDAARTVSMRLITTKSWTDPRIQVVVTDYEWQSLR